MAQNEDICESEVRPEDSGNENTGSNQPGRLSKAA